MQGIYIQYLAIMEARLGWTCMATSQSVDLSILIKEHFVIDTVYLITLFNIRLEHEFSTSR